MDLSRYQDMDHYPPTVSPIKPCEPIRPTKQVSIARIKACQRVFVHLRPQANNVEMTMTLWDASASVQLTANDIAGNHLPSQSTFATWR